MMPRTRSLEQFLCVLLLVVGLNGSVSAATNVTLRLSTGDRISGTIVSKTTNSVVLSNSWISELTIPLDRIVSGLSNTPPSVAANGAETMIFQEARPRSDTTSVVKTNGWRGEAQVGLDMLFGAKDRQILYGRFKLAYQQPYKSDPKKFFRNTFDYMVEYGTTESGPSDNRVTETTSDRMHASDKTSFDLRGRWYVYSLVGGGYDHILKIDAQYEAGPGIGYHLITRTNFTLNVEAGLNYQAQYRSDDSELQDVYYRLAQDISWKMWGRLSLVEKLEYFPRVNLTGHRMRFETTMKYDVWKNLSLNLTVLDLYDTEPAEGVMQNELQMRSSIGLKF